jgi:hypothetical protein
VAGTGTQRARLLAATPYVAIAGVVVALGSATAIGSSRTNVFVSTPTPAGLVPRGELGGEAPSRAVSASVPPNGVVGVDRPRVRLKETVLVHTAPSADSPRPAVSLLGEGMVASLLERRGEWVLIEYGPLIGWARVESVEIVR